MCVCVFSGNKIKKNELGGPCSLYERKVRCIQGFVAET
jgi:hypothetical protein